MADSVAALAARLSSAGSGMGMATRVGVEKACLAGKVVMLGALASAGLTGRISGVGAKGARANVRYDVRGVQNPVGILRYIGPVHLVNNATAPHEIAPRRKKAVSPRGNPWAAAYAQHPGTRGKKFAEKAEPIVLAQSKRIIVQEARLHLARTFAG